MKLISQKAIKKSHGWGRLPQGLAGILLKTVAGVSKKREERDRPARGIVNGCTEIEPASAT
jgi:hypothetical protein